MNETALLYAAASIIYLSIGIVALFRPNAAQVKFSSAAVDRPIPSRILYNFAGEESLTNRAVGGATLLTALWAASVAIWTDGSAAASSLEFVQTSGWFAVLLLLECDYVGRPRGAAWQLRLTIIGLGLLNAALVAGFGLKSKLIGSLSIDVRFLLSVATLVLIENIYRNAAEDARWHLNLPCIVVAGMSAYILLLYGDAVLHQRVSLALVDGRAVAFAILAPLLLFGIGRQRRWRRSLSLSRTAAFYSTTLLLSGAFLLGLGAAGEIFRSYGSGWGMVAEIALLFVGFVSVAMFITSGSARSHLRILVLDHFFSRRYDYQREWTRCLKTLGAAGDAGLEQRVIRVLADTVDSPAGCLFLREGARTGAAFTVAGVWNWPEPEAMIGPDDTFLARLAESGGIERAAKDEPPWLPTFSSAWMAVALFDPQTNAPVGIVFLARPRANFVPDREVLDLLRVVAREISLVLAERQAAEALAHARQFEEAGKRFAFVAHDIKNISSQLALLLSNASEHMDNPEFRQDMLGTLRASVDKINLMLMRLKAPYVGASETLQPCVRLAGMAASANAPGRAPVLFESDGHNAAIAVDDSAFNAVIGHLLDNAIDASPPDMPVRLRLRHEPEQIIIEIIDAGAGMNAAFVRDTLFRPFASSKPGGFGLGAFQARELVRAAGGELAVESVPGEGTTIRVTLPRVDFPPAHAAAEA